jgi:hypothetical protein
MTTESSVVVALREVRRLELERQRREEESRKREQEEERARAESAQQRASIQYGPGVAPYVNGQGWGQPEGHPEAAYTGSVRRTAEVVPLAAQAYAESQSVPAPPPGWLEEGVQFRPAPRQKSRFPAVLLTMILCGGAAAAGYWKLSGEWKAAVTRLEVENSQLEEQRNEAVAARSKGEQEMKVRLADLQSQLSAANRKNLAVESALEAAEEASNVAAAPLPSKRFNRMGGRRGRGGMRGFPSAIGKPVDPQVKLGPGPGGAGGGGEERPSPRVAKKKNLSDDPLGGLRL